jgi:hypothetical protein
VFKGSAFDSDFSAAIHLIGELRQEKQDIYINLTTGTYPSPSWLMYADSIWRGGEDDDTAGVGPYRERWITYRDADTYDEVVKARPLYPLNSLMLHGMIYAERHEQLKEDPSNSFRNEIRSYFGTGTQLQEMYITPSLLNTQNWDDLAEAAKWSALQRRRVEAHSLGRRRSSMGRGLRMGIVVAEEGDFGATQSKRQAAEHPSRSAGYLRASSRRDREFLRTHPWKEDASKPTVTLRAGIAHEFQLAPFEVLTLDVIPR